MEREELVSDEIIPWGQRSWNCARPLQIFVYNRGSPAGAGQGRSSHAHLIDLEPSSTRAITGSKCSRTFVHPNHYWALLMRPLCPYCGNCRASCHGSTEGSTGTSVTPHLDVGDGQSGIVVRPLSFNGSWGLSRAEALIPDYNMLVSTTTVLKPWTYPGYVVPPIE